MSIFDHFSIDDENEKLLRKDGISERDLLESLSLFDPIDSQSKFTKINLMYYLDAKGEFERCYTTPGKIAQAIMNSLDVKDQVSVYQYIEHILGDDDEESD